MLLLRQGDRTDGSGGSPDHRHGVVVSGDGAAQNLFAHSKCAADKLAGNFSQWVPFDVETLNQSERPLSTLSGRNRPIADIRELRASRVSPAFNHVKALTSLFSPYIL